MKRALLLVASVVGVGIGGLLVVVLLNVTIYAEASVPPRGALPKLPDGLRIVNETSGCGTGNCYREFDILADPGVAPDRIIAMLPTTEECSAHSLIDRRPLCIGYRLRDHGVEGYVSLGKWFGG